MDPYNRLIPPRFRKAVDGRFSLDRSGELIYQVKSPLSEGEKIPHQIRLSGKWSLTDAHKLRLTLNKLGRDTLGEQLTLEGSIIGYGENSLLFALTTTSKKGARTTYVMDFGGVWKADSRNRLTFHIKREAGRYDILTFNGAWDIDKRNKLSYSYETADLATKRRRVHTLKFDGHWDIRGRYRISYALGAGTDSSFDFKASAGIFKGSYIKYEVGIGLKGYARPVERVITLSGRWFLKEDVGVVFDLKYADKKTRYIAFGADFKLTGRDTVSLRLKTGSDNKDMGATVKLSRKIFKGDGEIFLRALVSGREKALYAGAAWRW